MKILCLTTNGPYEASTRYRVLQYEPALRARGHSLHVRTFFTHAHRHTKREVLTAFARQLQALLEDCDRVIVHRFAFPHLGNILVRLCKKPIIYDFDDALWLSAPREHAILVRAASRVLAGNAFLAEHARAEVFPTVIDTQIFKPLPKTIDVGWIGSATTRRYIEPLQRRLHVWTVPGDAEWSIEAEPRLFGQLSIGLYPLQDDDWSRGKCGLKALQYLACGVAPVMSPIGVVPEIAGDAALYARTPEEWVAHVRALQHEPAMRADLVAKARIRYTLDAYASRFVDIVEKG